jgi:hypothetical protein
VSSKRLQTERPVTYKIKYQFLSTNDDDNLIQFFIYSPVYFSTNTNNRNKTKKGEKETKTTKGTTGNEYKLSVKALHTQT